MIKNGDLPAMPLAYTREYPTSVGFEKHEEVCFGLTKREQFAMAAMQGILAKPEVSMNYAAQDAVKLADELLAELEKSK